MVYTPHTLIHLSVTTLDTTISIVPSCVKLSMIGHTFDQLLSHQIPGTVLELIFGVTDAGSTPVVSFTVN